MTKKGSEFPPLLMERVARKIGNQTFIGWVPADPVSAERISERYRVGAQVNFTTWEARDPRKLRLYWAILQECVANGEKYGRAEDLHNAVKIALGYKREIRLLNVGETSSLLMSLGVVLNKIRMVSENSDTIFGKLIRPLVKQAFEIAENVGGTVSDTIILPGSIALDKMDEGEFRIFFDRAMNELRRAGYPIDEIMEASKQKLARTRARQTPPLNYGDSNYGRSQTPPREDRGVKDPVSKEAAA